MERECSKERRADMRRGECKGGVEKNVKKRRVKKSAEGRRSLEEKRQKMEKSRNKYRECKRGREKSIEKSRTV